MNTKKQKVLLIIPAYNEEESILNVVNKIYNYNKENNTKNQCCRNTKRKIIAIEFHSYSWFFHGHIDFLLSIYHFKFM